MNQNISEIDLGIGLDDSELISCSRAQDQLIIRIKTWNDKNLQFVFSNIILLIDHVSPSLTSFCELMGFPEILKQALKELYEKIPESHPYHLYQFLNIDDEPSIEIVCKSYSFLIEQDLQTL